MLKRESTTTQRFQAAFRERLFTVGKEERAELSTYRGIQGACISPRQFASFFACSVSAKALDASFTLAEFTRRYFYSLAMLPLTDTQCDDKRRRD